MEKSYRNERDSRRRNRILNKLSGGIFFAGVICVLGGTVAIDRASVIPSELKRYYGINKELDSKQDIKLGDLESKSTELIPYANGLIEERDKLMQIPGLVEKIESYESKRQEDYDRGIYSLVSGFGLMFLGATMYRPFRGHEKNKQHNKKA